MQLTVLDRARAIAIQQREERVDVRLTKWHRFGRATGHERQDTPELYARDLAIAISVELAE